MSTHSDRTRDAIQTAIHSSARALLKVGGIDESTMREFDQSCLAIPPEIAPRKIKQIRESNHVSQPTFARYLNTSESTIQKWETGAKRPSGLAHKLLAIIQKHGWSGKLHDVRGRAENRASREMLRDAVRGIERFRASAGRIDADKALENCEGLISGRWAMVDRFDTDGRRFVVAIKNDPVYRDPRGLTERERQVAEFVGLGRSPTDSALNAARLRRRRKQLHHPCTGEARRTSRAELVAYFSSRVRDHSEALPFNLQPQHPPANPKPSNAHTIPQDLARKTT